ncbi:hypothetical protein FVF58_09475 [Paraburkholderia panacisoli]|uniref:Antitermination protein n=1 Tax=Paraburkholderia panacisoli TaxID=2603818 RepID=A0A5B0HD88_9BURK|nr:hypothetical protein [Paraburkholderia panacisoli]KAA1013010.1 hypothetical protein FVF58_09475 [Paraburkholderia panacisoli]
MFKDKYASDVRSSNLAWNEREEKAIDRLTAIGMSDQLGAALFRFKFGSDAFSGKRAIHLLAHKAKCNLGVELSYATKLATACIKEFVLDNCVPCNGTGLILNGARYDKCGKCGGSGVKRHSDSERALAAGLPVENFARNHQKKFDQVMTCMMASVAATGAKTRQLLRDAA